MWRVKTCSGHPTRRAVNHPISSNCAKFTIFAVYRQLCKNVHVMLTFAATSDTTFFMAKIIKNLTQIEITDGYLIQSQRSKFYEFTVLNPLIANDPGITLSTTNREAIEIATYIARAITGDATEAEALRTLADFLKYSKH